MRRTMLLALPAAALVLAGCAGSPATPEEAVAIEKKAMSEGIDRQMMPLYVTTWLEPVPAQFGRQQGFILDEGGSAESVNMATLKYESWQVADRKLTLRGKSIGNGGYVRRNRGRYWTQDLTDDKIGIFFICLIIFFNYAFG